MRLPVRIVIPCSALTGWGGFALGLLRQLQNSSRIAPEWAALYNTIQPSFPEEYRHLIGATANARRLGLVIGTPDRAAQSGTDYTILYTMYEADDIPAQWGHDVRRADEVWVPSEYCRRTFSRYHPRVKVVHMGFDDTVYNRQRGPRKGFWRGVGLPLLEHGFVVGTAGVMSWRKGVDILVTAFLRAFPDDFRGDRQAFLVIKTRDSRVRPVRHERIFWIDQNWSPHRMAEFYRALDVFVLSSRGEGFSLCPLEAANCGTLALTTRYGGPCEYIDDQNILGINVAGEEPVSGMMVERAKWARPSVAHLTLLLSRCYNAPRRIRPNLSYWGIRAAARRFEDELLQAARRAR